MRGAPTIVCNPAPTDERMIPILTIILAGHAISAVNSQSLYSSPYRVAMNPKRMGKLI